VIIHVALADGPVQELPDVWL